jgi:hypothetical protein
MTLAEIIHKLRTEPTQTVPFTGMALGGIRKGAAYQAAKDKTLGVDAFWVGGQLRCASIDILTRLGVEPEAKSNKPTDTAPAAVVAPAIQSAAPKSAPAKSRKTAPKAIAARKTPARKAAAPPRPARRQSQSEAVS